MLGPGPNTGANLQKQAVCKYMQDCSFAEWICNDRDDFELEGKLCRDIEQVTAGPSRQIPASKGRIPSLD